MQNKVIHYCWFGPKEIPNKEKKCIESWKKLLPDYELMLWNENNFDINSNNFCKEAYDNQKFAFVSDYVRTKVLFEYGGLYLDTDVEVFEGIEKVLDLEENFMGFETRAKLGTAIIFFNKNHPIIGEFLNYYENNTFVNKSGEQNTIANVTIITDILEKYGLITDGSNQIVNDIRIYNREYFYPKKLSDDEFRFTEKTVAVHRCSNSWMTDREKRRGKNILWINIMRPILRSLRNFGLKILGEKYIQLIEIKLRNFLK